MSKIIEEFNEHVESSLYYIHFWLLKNWKIKGLNDTRLLDNNDPLVACIIFIFENLKSCKIKGLNDTRLIDNNNPLLERNFVQIEG